MREDRDGNIKSELSFGPNGRPHGENQKICAVTPNSLYNRKRERVRVWKGEKGGNAIILTLGFRTVIQTQICNGRESIPLQSVATCFTVTLGVTRKKGGKKKLEDF